MKNKLAKALLGSILIVALGLPAISCSDTGETQTTSQATQTTSQATQTTSQATQTTSQATTQTSSIATQTTSVKPTTTTTTGTTTADTTDKKDYEWGQRSAADNDPNLKKFGLADIPEIKNKTTINIALEAGGSADVIIPYVKKFSEKTGVPVTYEQMLMSVIYPKVNVDLISGTGSYDITVVESTTTCEWAPFFWKVRDLANTYDPNGFEGLIADLKGHHYVALRSACDENGDLYGLPYYATQGAMMLRQDVFDDPTEQANFKAKYGYDLAPAKTWEDIYNQGEFFTRNQGDLLKGKALEWDIYGLTFMAGRFEINDEISGFLQGMNSDWATTIRDEKGKIQEFVITKKNKSDLNYILTEYQKNLIWCSPGCLTGFWDFCTAQFETGKTIVAPTLYVPLDQWAWGVVEKVGGGAKLGLYTTIGGSPFQGTFHQAVNLSTKNPEACYWLQRYLSCYEGQKQMCENGWNGVRADIYRDSQYQTDKWYRIIGQRAGVVMEMWDYQWPYVNDLLCRNSDAMGKIYEAQIIICHEAVTGVTSIEEGVQRMTETTIEIQRKFGSIPIREES